MKLVIALVAGMVLGSSMTVLAVNAWPKVRLAPELVVQSTLHFGVASDGFPALCDKDGNAYRLRDSGGGLFRPIVIIHSTDPSQLDNIDLMACKPWAAANAAN